MEHPAMQLLLSAMRRDYYLKAALCIVAVVSGGMASFCFFRQKSILVFISAAIILGGFIGLYQIIRQPRIQDHPLWQLLYTESGRRQIVWVYGVITQVMPFGLQVFGRGTLFFKLNNGQEICIHLPANRLRMVSKYLNRILPHAVFGYTEERERLFAENPSALAKDNSQ